MPIGKNAIKRVSNNGYSNVKAAAPDMENSVVVEEKDTALEKKQAAAKKASTTKAEPKPKAEPRAKVESKAEPKAKAPKKATPSPKKSMETEPKLSPVKTAQKVVGNKPQRQGDGYVNLGGELPYYLL